MSTVQKGAAEMASKEHTEENIQDWRDISMAAEDRERLEEQDKAATTSPGAGERGDDEEEDL